MRPKAMFILNAGSYSQIYGPEEVADIEKMCDVFCEPQTKESVAAHPELLAETEIIFSGWGAPKLDAAFLEKAPKLKAVFYGAGSVRGMVTDEMWERGIIVTSSWAANAIPVSEYTLAEILFSLKLGWRWAYRAKAEKAYPKKDQTVPGCYGSTIGLISLGMIGKLVANLLKQFNLKVIAYDPFTKPETAAELGVTMKSLNDVFAEADVVSCHTPWLKETENMIRGEHFKLMKPNATFINTARGAVIAEEEMLDVMEARPDLTAVLDVTYPEPPKPGSRIYTLPNVILTPHVAGSMAAECRRMGRYAVEMCQCYLAGKPMKWQLNKKMAETMA